ncbi:MAG: amidohydrolase [Litorimonas sp.]
MIRSLLMGSALLLGATPALATDLFLDNATVIRTDGSTETLDLRIRNGRIDAMASRLREPSNMPTLSGAWVSPGLVAPFSTLGIVDIGGESSTNDTSAETELFSAAIQAADSFNPLEVHIANARQRGVMHAAVALRPAGDVIFGGIGMVASLDGSFDSILDETAFMHVALGEAGASRAGGSRGAAMQQIRSALDDARRSYLTQGHVEGDVFARRDARAFRDVASGDMPLMISVSRASDLLRVVALKDDYPDLDIILVGAEEAYLVAEDLADNGIRVIVDPVENLPDTFDSVNASFDNILELEAAGVDYAIAPLSALGTVKTGIIAQHAGNAVGQGLPRDAAMRAITSTPARWFGIEMEDASVGSDATMIVWDGDPLEVTSAPVAMYSEGEELSLESRMTALRDRYNPATEDDRPFSYR